LLTAGNGDVIRVDVTQATSTGGETANRSGITRTDSLGKFGKGSIIGNDLNLPSNDCKGNVEGICGGETYINRLITATGYT
jgi:hypothetical protein